MTLLLIHPRERLIFYATVSHWLIFFQFMIQYKPQTLFCSSAILPGIGHFVLDFALLSSSAFTSTKLHFVDLRSWVSPLRLVPQLVQSHQLQLQALFLPVETLLVSKCPSKAGPRLEWSSPGLGSLIKEGPPEACRGEIAVMLQMQHFLSLY